MSVLPEMVKETVGQSIQEHFIKLFDDQNLEALEMYIKKLINQLYEAIPDKKEFHME